LLCSQREVVLSIDDDITLPPAAPRPTRPEEARLVVGYVAEDHWTFATRAEAYDFVRPLALDPVEWMEFALGQSVAQLAGRFAKGAVRITWLERELSTHVRRRARVGAVTAGTYGDTPWSFPLHLFGASATHVAQLCQSPERADAAVRDGFLVSC